ncbi:DUF6086 family protein [Streptomyces anulatus]|uniref:DUF6086 family protein n=1 Tax=Streptomyces TaxID=1883 RepID=UPI001300C991|nr:DUF6086 family protein [Streptomyces anulatus]MCX4487812.1 DUF6086 family protein [Streptomyces anulatus]
MSYYFDIDGETVWDAGSRTGRLYASLAEGAAESMGLPSGLTPNEQGGCDIDLPAFRIFTEGLYETYSSTRNPVLHGVVRGVLIASLVVLEAAGTPITLKPEHEKTLREEKKNFARAMS